MINPRALLVSPVAKLLIQSPKVNTPGVLISVVQLWEKLLIMKVQMFNGTVRQGLLYMGLKL